MAAPRPAGGWMKGVVKEVPSGDTLVIASGSRRGAPEKRISLSSLVAPKLGKRDGTTPDEPFAWEAREFTRKLCIGKACTFRVDYAIAGRELGSVFIGPNSLNVALKVVAEGWAKVRPGGGQQSPYIEQLTQLAQGAEAAGKGVWAKTGQSARKGWQQITDASEVLAKHGKGKPLAAVVEYVINASLLRVTLLDDCSTAVVQVCGIQTPPINPPAPAAEGGEPPAAAPAHPPFGADARHFAEQALLHREVRCVLQGLDKRDNLFASVVYPAASPGPAASGPEEPQFLDLGQQLAERGLARLAEWSLATMVTGAQLLRDAERKAKKARAGIWHDYTPPPSSLPAGQNEFSGPVREVVSGDTLAVWDAASGTERRVSLSSIKAPRLGTRSRAHEPLAWEARDFLRRRLIGKEVAVSLEYRRKIPPAEDAEPGSIAASERSMDFGTVTFKDKAGQTNVAELVLAQGLATLQRHRADDERSLHYQTLLETEQAAAAKKVGLHKAKAGGGAAAEPFRANDISLPGQSAKAKQFLPFLSRARVTAVVDAVLSGNRLKLHVEREGLIFACSPSGVRAPARPQPASGGRPAVAGEPCWQEAIAFTREHFLQREVEVQVERVDRGGTFLGSVTLKGGKQLDLGRELLARGLAKLHAGLGGRELSAAEEDARLKRIGVWKDWVPTETKGAAEPAADGPGERDVPVTVTEIVHAGEFYIQRQDEPRVKWIEEQIQALKLDGGAAPAARLAAGATCLARFSVDGRYYRASVLHADTKDPVSPAYYVRFLDFGNRERVRGEEVRAIDAALSAVPPQARQASLAGIKVRDLDDEFGVRAAQLLHELTGGGRQLLATVTRGRFASQQPMEVVLKEAGAEGSVNAALLQSGAVRLAPRRKLDAATEEALEAAEQVARRGHKGLWEYGDPGESEDEL